MFAGTAEVTQVEVIEKQGRNSLPLKRACLDHKLTVINSGIYFGQGTSTLTGAFAAKTGAIGSPSPNTTDAFGSFISLVPVPSLSL